MKKRIFGILFALVLVLGLSLVMAVPAVANGGNTWYVDPTGTDDPSHGIALGTDAFQTIGYAISRAFAGDTINVAAGTYNEDITLKDGVEVLGEGAGSTTINGTGTYRVVTAISVGATTKIDGFTITGGNYVYGGGMYIHQYSSPVVSNCTFSANTAYYGGGMYTSFSSPVVTNCTFSSNTAVDGGGMFHFGSSPVVTNCTFSANTTTGDGGGMHNDNSTFGSSPVVTNCTFSGNSATGDGGGMHNENSNPTVTNCIISSNIASAGGGIYADGASSPIIDYNDVWNNTGGDYSGCSAGTHDISQDPLFVGGGDYHLQSGSPCIDVGNNSASSLPATDFDSNLRIIDGNGDLTLTVDMGVDEYQPIYYVSTTGANGNDGLSWPTAWRDSQYAIDQCLGGEVINVAAGTYMEDITLVDGVEVLGAGAGSTTIYGTGIGSVVTASGVGATTVLDGFTITNGSTVYGGGMHNSFSSPMVSNCTFSSNSATYGGGMYNHSSSPTVTGCTFSSNHADGGGGVYNFLSSSPIVTGCTFLSNIATNNGGGMCNDNNSSPTVSGCTFDDNEAANGGGMFNSYSSPTVTGCTFSNAAEYGAGMYNSSSSSPAVTSCTFDNNPAINYGGGMFNVGCSPTVTCCTFSGNSATYGGGMSNYSYSSPTVTGCTFSGNTAYDDGGGMSNEDYCSPKVTNCTFSANTATDSGGGMQNITYSSPTVTGCTFDGNLAGWAGAGMYNNYYCSPTVTNCTFSVNIVTYDGGGIANFNNCSPTVTGCTFSGNTATAMGGTGGGMCNHTSSPEVTDCTFDGNSVTNGGGMYNSSSSSTVTDCTFSNNTATGDGGGMFNSIVDASLTVTNCIFSANTADDEGGGMYNTNNSSPTLTNCTFSANTADDGGGVYNYASSPTLINCILWGDIGNGGEIWNGYLSSAIVSYCDVQGGYSGTGNIDSDPLFVNPGAGDYHIQGTSPCIDAGNNTAVPVGITTDFDGEPRIIDGDGDTTATVDMGVDECLAQVWVDAGWTSQGDVDAFDPDLTWQVDAFATITAAVDAVVAGGTVNVYPGDYIEKNITIDKSLTVESVYGDWHDTVVDPAGGPVFGFYSFGGDATISGLTITAGDYGIYIEGLSSDGSITVRNCLIYDNGNGIFAGDIIDGDIFIDECIITDNGSAAHGISLTSINGNVDITDNVIGAFYDDETETNYAGNSGDGIAIGIIGETGIVRIDQNYIVENGGHGIADAVGGCFGQLTITNNIIGAYDYDLASPAGLFTGNSQSGVSIDHVGVTGAVTIEGNRISENYYGVSFGGLDIVGEVIINNNYIGAWTDYTTFGDFYSHGFDGNTEKGITVATVAADGSLIIINNKIAENSEPIPDDIGVFIDTTAGDTIISANHIGPWTQDIPGGSPVSYEGNGGPGIRINNVAGGSLLIHGNTIAENADATSGIHIDSASDGADISVNLNDILDNVGDGIYYNYGGAGCLETLDATNNWWGDTSGPGGEGLGTGDEVSANVDYEPWLRVSVENALAGTITDGTLDNIDGADTEVIVTGSATVTSAKYSGNPGSGFSGDTGKYIDVHIDNPTGVTEIEIRLYYTDAEIAGLAETSLLLRWWNGAFWMVCSDIGVNTTDITGPPAYSGYMWARIRSDTTPSLAQLIGSIFGGGGEALITQVPPLDTIAPQISNVSICGDGVTETTADICWRTNEQSTSQVEYEASPGILSPLDTAYVNEHHVRLTGLTPCTTYSYRTMSMDRAGNLAVSDTYTFTTLGEATFTSSDLSISPGDVSIGETVNIGVVVTNTSDCLGSYTVTLKINDAVEETREVALETGASESVTFTASMDEAGVYSVDVDGLSGSFTVEAPASPHPTAPPEADDSTTTSWGLIGGIIAAAVVIIGLTSLFVARRRTS